VTEKQQPSPGPPGGPQEVGVAVDAKGNIFVDQKQKVTYMLTNVTNNEKKR
jgi:hypothetical protein